MGGLVILLLIGLYISVAVWVVRRQKSMRAKLIAMVIALLIPSADAILGRIYLQHLCDTEGGLKVYRVVEGVEGFMENGLITRDYWVKQYAYQFVEDSPVNGKVTRYSRQGNAIAKEDNVEPKSNYRIRSSKIGLQSVYPRYNYFVEDIKSDEVLAQYSEIGFSGGWAERFLARFSDAGVGAVDWCTPRPWNEDFRAIVVTASLKR